MNRESLEGRRWIGRVLRDRWRIDARISRGGVGTVYAATHMNNGSRAAIKVLHPEFSRDADTRSRFLQEGYAANQVNHPGVVRILDDDTSDDGHAYLVMELLEGELLETRRVRKGGKLPFIDIYEVGEQLLDVLATAHEKGIVHRDIKPDNLFITREGRLKVLDFGFAQMRSAFRPEQTATGFLLGTPGFMSPEQAIGNRAEVDAQTDIWAVGATLFTLISGQPVHDGQSAAEMLVAAANFPPRSLASVASGLNPRLIEIVDRAVAFNKADRWPNARMMQMALRSVSGKQAAGQVSRQSIPDFEPQSEPTLYEDGDEVEIEELDANELVDSKSERTIVAAAERELPDAAMPSGITRPAPLPAAGRPAAGRPAAGRPAHPADEDGPTLAVSSPADAQDHAPVTRPPLTPQMLAHPGAAMPLPSFSSSFDPQGDGGTLIMESPVRDDASGSGAYPQLGKGPVPTSFGHQPFNQTVQLGSEPQMMPRESLQRPPTGAEPYGLTAAPRGPAPQPMQQAPQAQQAPAAPASRALIFIGVVVVTMVVVIVTGLLILSASD